MLVSVIVPVYNAAPWLERCLDSIIGQTYPSLEIILVNDGSGDASPEICRRYERSGSAKIIVVDQENGGPSRARNAGLEMAGGDAVMFADADDFLEPDMVAVMASAMERSGCGLALCGCRQWSDDGFERFILPGRDGAFPWYESLMGFAREDVAAMTLFASMWNKIYKANMIKPLRFDAVCPGTDIPVFPQEDFFLNMEYLSRCDEVFFVDASLYNYRVHAANVNAVRKYRPHAFPLHREVYNHIEQAIRDKCTEPEKRRFNRHYIDKTLIILAMLCRDNPVFGHDALLAMTDRIVNDSTVRRRLANCYESGSQDDALVEKLRRREVGELFEWARKRGNEVYNS